MGYMNAQTGVKAECVIIDCENDHVNKTIMQHITVESISQNGLQE